jgi:nucleoside-diphosphate-sugar epimerase
LKIAVTGATGFIGRHVLAELHRQGLEPTVIVRPGGTSSAAAPSRSVVECDLKNPPADLFEAIGRPQTLIHLAWGGLPHYKSLHHFEEELPAHYRFLKTLVSSGLDACVVTGTCLEYGMQSGELSEGAATHPTTAYGFAKDCLRRQLEWLRDEHPFGLTWARLFYTYGEGQAATSLPSLLKAAAARGDKSFDMSDGKQLRDYLPVQDVARSIVQLAVAGRDEGVVNVCSGSPISVRDLVEGWMAANGWTFTLNLGRYAYPDYEPVAFWGSRRKLDAAVNLPAASNT